MLGETSNKAAHAPSVEDHTLKTNPSKTPEEREASKQKVAPTRREYDRARSQNPERKEYWRLLAQEKRQRAKELGQCRNCSKQAIPGQTRCPTCAEKHRESRRRGNAKRRA